MKSLTIKNLSIIAAALALMNILLSIFLSTVGGESTYEHLNGESVSSRDPAVVRAVIYTMLISIPVFSFLIGLIVTIFIERDLPYSKRIVKGFLLTLTTIYGIFALMALRSSIVGIF